MATSVTIPGAGTAPPLVFTVTGASTTNQALAFQNALVTASQNGNLQINILSNAPGSRAHGPANATVVLNEIFSNASAVPYTITSGGQYTLIDVGTATSVTGSGAGGDSVLGAGDSTYQASGGHNVVTFVDGTNTYIGGANAGDTVTAGSGYDTIDTGTAATTVFSGSGSALINLNGTTGNDVVDLGDGGKNTVVANAIGSIIYDSTAGNTIFGGGSTNTTTLLTISSNGSTSASGNEFVGGAGGAVVFDTAGGNTIFGGTGSTSLVVGANVADTVTGGAGSLAIFSASGADITLNGASTVSTAYFIAGSGNETLNGANAGSFAFFGSSDSAANDSVVGGSATDYFITGAGTENLTAGTGTDLFDITTGHAAHITITDFSAKDYVAISGQDSATTAQELASGTVSGGNYTVTLADNTTITFVGLNSFTGHTL